MNETATETYTDLSSDNSYTEITAEDYPLTSSDHDSTFYNESIYDIETNNIDSSFGTAVTIVDSSTDSEFDYMQGIYCNTLSILQFIEFVFACVLVYLLGRFIYYLSN